jgi:hypothetical protein
MEHYQTGLVATDELHIVRATCTINYSKVLERNGMMSIEKNKIYYLLGYNDNGMYFISDNETTPFSDRLARCGYIHCKYLSYNTKPDCVEPVGRRRKQ